METVPEIKTPTKRSVELRELVMQHKQELYEVLHEYGADNLRIKGSVARGDADENSDIDLVYKIVKRPFGMFKFIWR